MDAIKGPPRLDNIATFEAGLLQSNTSIRPDFHTLGFQQHRIDGFEDGFLMLAEGDYAGELKSVLGIAQVHFVHRPQILQSSLRGHFKAAQAVLEDGEEQVIKPPDLPEVADSARLPWRSGAAQLPRGIPSNVNISETLDTRPGHGILSHYDLIQAPISSSRVGLRFRHLCRG